MEDLTMENFDVKVRNIDHVNAKDQPDVGIDCIDTVCNTSIINIGHSTYHKFKATSWAVSAFEGGGYFSQVSLGLDI